MLPERSILIGQKWAENAKIEVIKCDILGDFQTMCDVFGSNEKDDDDDRRLRQKLSVKIYSTHDDLEEDGSFKAKARLMHQ